MDGLMMDRPLLVKQIAERAAAVFGRREVVARTQGGVGLRLLALGWYGASFQA